MSFRISKRRRVSEEQSRPEVTPSAVGSSTTQHAATTGTAGGGDVKLMSLETWEEIPELLVVKMQKQNPTEVEEHLRRLAKLISVEDGDDNKNKKAACALQFGGPAIVLLIMKKFPDRRYIQACGCLFFQSLLSLQSSVEAVVKIGGMEAVMNAMKHSGSSCAAHFVGLDALMNLFSSSVNGEYIGNQVCRRFVNDLDGLQFTLDVLEKFFNNNDEDDDEAEDVVHSCCRIFWMLATIQELHAPMKASGVIGAVGKVLDRYADNKNITTQGKGFMLEMMKGF